jgi:ligand-binding sensor domain-containing protein
MMRTFLQLTLIISLLAITPFILNAQWIQTNSPGVASVSCFIENGGKLYMGTQSQGVFVCSKNNSQWTNISNGLTDKNIRSLASIGTTLFASTNSNGIFRSTDNGASWQPCASTQMNLYSLVSIGNILFGSISYQVVFSTDSGATWQSTSFQESYLYYLATSGTYLYAGGLDGISLSTDNGASWNYISSIKTGLYGVTAMSVKTGNLLVAATNGIFLSTNSGTNWDSINTELPTKDIRAVLDANGTFFAATWGYGIVRSFNNGGNWATVNSGLTSKNIQALWNSGDTIFAGGDHGVFISTNGGTTWQEEFNGLPRMPYNCMAITSGHNLYAGSKSAGIFLSTDFGTTWTTANKGLKINVITGLVQTPGEEFFAGGFGDSSGIYSFSMIDTSWRRLHSPAPYSIAGTDDYLFAGTGGPDWGFGELGISTDRGTTWDIAAEIGGGMCYYYALSVFSLNGRMTILAGLDFGMFLSTDTGASWSSKLTFYGHMYDTSITAFGQMDSNIFAATNGYGIYRSTDAGFTWDAMNEGLTSAVAKSFATSGDKIFAGTSTGVFVTTRGGSNWIPFNSHLSDLNITSLVIGDNTIYAGTGGSGIWRRPLSELTIYTITAGAGPGGTITPQGNYVMAPASTRSFSFVPNPGYVVGRVVVDGVAVDSVSGYTFTNVTANHSLYVTFGNIRVANGWNLVSLPKKTDDYSIGALFPTAVSSAYSYTGVYTQQNTLSNGCGYWIKFDGAQAVNFSGDTLAADTISVTEGWNLIGSIGLPVPVNTIGSLTEGLTLSQFFGYAKGYAISDTLYPAKGYWTKANKNGVIVLSASSLVSAAQKIRIVPSSELPPSPPGLVESKTQELPKTFTLDQNYPNPFNPATVINYQLPQGAYVSLKVYNILGQEITTLVEGYQEAGYKSIKFDIANLPSGVYIYSIVAGSYTDAKKMLLMR